MKLKLETGTFVLESFISKGLSITQKLSMQYFSHEIEGS